jgi:hypothetical protein
MPVPCYFFNYLVKFVILLVSFHVPLEPCWKAATEFGVQVHTELPRQMLKILMVFICTLYSEAVDNVPAKHWYVSRRGP